MSTQASDITIKIDDRIRLLSVALSATTHPEQAQQKKRHQPHAHARATRKYVLDNGHASHPAIEGLQQMLDRNVPLEALFTLVMLFDWSQKMSIKALPAWVADNWNKHLWDFYEKAEIQSYWDNESNVWDQAESQSRRVFQTVQFHEFLSPFVGDFEENLIFMPNLCYPADENIGIRVGNDLIAITPPPLAWGDSPPWPFDEETLLNHSYRATLTEYGRLLLKAYLGKHPEALEQASQKEMPVNENFKKQYPTWEDQFIALFVSAAVAMYLEDYMNKAEAKSYILMEKKVRGMTILPGTVSVMRRYLQEVGNRYENLIEFLPIFPAQLRVAKRIVKS